MANVKKNRIKFDYYLLKIRIRAIYGNFSNFAKKIGVRREYLCRKLSNQIDITSYEVVTWSELLEISPNLIGTFFYTPLEENEDAES